MTKPDSGHTDSYYAASTPAAPGYPKLNADIETETCVIGGGFAGLTVARELARRGRGVVLLEARCIGWGASGRNGGFVSPGYAADIFALERRLGKAHAKELYDLSREGAVYVRKCLSEPDFAGILGGQGRLRLTRHSCPDKIRRTRNRLEADYGHRFEVWDTATVRESLRTTSYHDGLYDPESFDIHPLAYANALAATAARAGASIFEASQAGSVSRVHDYWRIAAPGGSVRAGHVVLAGSAYGALSGLHPPLDRAIVPVATYVVTSEPMLVRLNEAIGFPGAIGDTRRAGDYYRKLSDGRLMWGGRITTRRSQPHQLAALLKRDILRIYPSLGDFRITHAWSGLMGYAVHKMPIVGEIAPGLWSCTAFGGHGINTTASGGLLIAGAIAEGDERWRLFAPFGARWAGGPLGRLATQLEYWRMQALDRWQERGSGDIQTR
ncbi:MAG: FAD-binding oxidoreductase [Alphaproteobacteria bacterium]|nr:FAD-binding oxidoreductase [Alphaproteobacteria bacterium]